MLKQTRNRKAILKCLSEPDADCGLPPFSASDVHYLLEHGFVWYGLTKPVSISQINRTLRDLLKAGVIVKETRLDEPRDTGLLASRVNYYQLADAVDRNALLREIDQVLRTAGTVHGTFLFGTDHYFREPFDPAPVIADIKGLMQRTHPDKVAGYEAEFDQLNKALKYCRAKIDLLKTPNKRLKLGR
jgi:hypothetical protein